MLLDAIIQRRSSFLNLVNVFGIIVIFLTKGNCVNLGFFEQIFQHSGSSAGCAFLMRQIFLFPLFEIDVSCMLVVAFSKV